jgi:hypothetical protein
MDELTKVWQVWNRTKINGWNVIRSIFGGKKIKSILYFCTHKKLEKLKADSNKEKR